MIKQGSQVHYHETVYTRQPYVALLLEDADTDAAWDHKFAVVVFDHVRGLTHYVDLAYNRNAGDNEPMFHLPTECDY